MWNDARQKRFDELREAEAQGTLTAEERSELTALIAERCQREAAAIEAAAQQAEEQNTELEGQIQQLQAQNNELEALVHEQEAYLAEVQAMIARMEERRRDWRERYAKVTGRPLGDRVAP
jgi:chromosome segregation ATPase